MGSTAEGCGIRNTPGYRLRPTELRDLAVHGSFITEAHLTLSLALSSHGTFNISYRASALGPDGWSWTSVNGSCDGQPFLLGPHHTKDCEDLSAQVDLGPCLLPSGASS